MIFEQEMRAAQATFVIESRELLQDMEHALLGLEQEASADTINAIFRAAHTIKGSAGLFGLDHIVRFTHVVESVLDALRDGQIAISSKLIEVLLPCRDHIHSLIEAVADGEAEEDAEQARNGAALITLLHPFLGQSGHLPVTHEAAPLRAETSGGGRMENGNWHLSLRFGPNCLRDGMDPLAFIRYLSTLGDVVHLTTVSTGLPATAEMDAETCYLGFEISLNSTADKAAIEGVFDFVREDSQIRILPPHSRIDDFIALIAALPEDDAFIGEILVNSGVLTRRELEQALQQQRTEEVAAPLGELLVEQQIVQQPILDAALAKQKQGKENKQRENQSQRVDADRLDRLIDLIGELVIAGAGTRLHAAACNGSKRKQRGSRKRRARGDQDRALENTVMRLVESTAEVMRLVEAVRDNALQLRMVPIGTTFSRFQRVVRDVAAELGKDIQLVVSGGDTEVDKSVAEKIADPLLHLVRNSIDHGIESAALRAERGKPPRGTLRLNAHHESGSIVIEVADDGGGLNRDRILAKAIERGLVAPSAVLSDADIYALIFAPGFSTADQVSSLSGRGVGMDVVKRNVTALRGIIDINSHPGQGASIRIRLPLTLAIIDGFLVSVGTASFVVPLSHVIECMELPDKHSGSYLDLRGEVLPLIRLRQQFAMHNLPPRRENVVVVSHAGSKTGLVVDRLQGEFQTVIKPLGVLFSHLRGISGSTILGNGEVALILDVGALIQHFGACEKARFATAQPDPQFPDIASASPQSLTK
jgi:two-component system chemotaxis sensor kinase CheA